jgi:hypothetical protein
MKDLLAVTFRTPVWIVLMMVFTFGCGGGGSSGGGGGAAPQTFTIALVQSGEGSGYIASEPSGLSCGTVCESDFPDNQTVVLTVQSEAGSYFAGWNTDGVCHGQGVTCSFQPDAEQTLTAEFAPLTDPEATLSVSDGKLTLSWKAYASATQFRIYLADTPIDYENPDQEVEIMTTNDPEAVFDLSGYGYMVVTMLTVHNEEVALIERDLPARARTYSKIDNQGNVLPDDAEQWQCILDHETGLVWQHKTQEQGLHYVENTYTWYMADERFNEGEPGNMTGGNCQGSACYIDAYVAAVNAEGLCGRNDWRMPAFDELAALRACRYSGQTYFPLSRNETCYAYGHYFMTPALPEIFIQHYDTYNDTDARYWSRDTDPFDPLQAKIVNYFNSDASVESDKALSNQRVRLVSGEEPSAHWVNVEIGATPYRVEGSEESREVKGDGDIELSVDGQSSLYGEELRLPHGATVTFTARPDENSIFVGWEGDCSGTDPVCTVTMTESTWVRPVFSERFDAGRWADQEMLAIRSRNMEQNAYHLTFYSRQEDSYVLLQQHPVEYNDFDKGFEYSIWGNAEGAVKVEYSGSYHLPQRIVMEDGTEIEILSLGRGWYRFLASSEIFVDEDSDPETPAYTDTLTLHLPDMMLHENGLTDMQVQPLLVAKSFPRSFSMISKEGAAAALYTLQMANCVAMGQIAVKMKPLFNPALKSLATASCFGFIKNSKEMISGTPSLTNLNIIDNIEEEYSQCDGVISCARNVIGGFALGMMGIELKEQNQVRQPLQVFNEDDSLQQVMTDTVLRLETAEGEWVNNWFGQGMVGPLDEGVEYVLKISHNSQPASKELTLYYDGNRVLMRENGVLVDYSDGFADMKIALHNPNCNRNQFAFCMQHECRETITGTDVVWNDDAALCEEVLPPPGYIKYLCGGSGCGTLSYRTQDHGNQYLRDDYNNIIGGGYPNRIALSRNGNRLLWDELNEYVRFSLIEGQTFELGYVSKPEQPELVQGQLLVTWVDIQTAAHGHFYTDQVSPVLKGQIRQFYLEGENRWVMDDLILTREGEVIPMVMYDDSADAPEDKMPIGSLISGGVLVSDNRYVAGYNEYVVLYDVSDPSQVRSLAFNSHANPGENFIETETGILSWSSIAMEKYDSVTLQKLGEVDFRQAFQSYPAYDTFFVPLGGRFQYFDGSVLILLGDNSGPSRSIAIETTNMSIVDRYPPQNPY